VSERRPDQKPLQSPVRAHIWLIYLSGARYASIENLANIWCFRCYHPAVWMPKQIPDAATSDNQQSEAQ
jgi:hypothetical protein